MDVFSVCAWLCVYATCLVFVHGCVYMFLMHVCVHEYFGAWWCIVVCMDI